MYSVLLSTKIRNPRFRKSALYRRSKKLIFSNYWIIHVTFFYLNTCKYPLPYKCPRKNPWINLSRISRSKKRAQSRLSVSTLCYIHYIQLTHTKPDFFRLLYTKSWFVCDSFFRNFKIALCIKFKMNFGGLEIWILKFFLDCNMCLYLNF